MRFSRIVRQRRGWYVVTAILAAALLFCLFRGQPRLHPQPYRVGFQSDLPYQIVHPDGTADGLGVQVVRVAAGRLGIPLQGIHCPEGPDVALGSGKVNLWPLLTERPERNGKVPIVAVTANAADSDARRCLDSGMDDFLAKPFRVAALGAKLERWLPEDCQAATPTCGK